MFSYVELCMDCMIQKFSSVDLYELMDGTVHIFSDVDVAGSLGGGGSR